MKTITIILFTVILNGCGNAKTTTETSIESTNAVSETAMDVSKNMQEDIKIEYRAHTRGSFKKIIIENKTVSVQNTYDGKAEVKQCSSENWEALMTTVEKTDLKTMTKLEAPSKAHQYDGAAMANFTITKNGEIYDVPVFDAGNPNKEIEELVNMVLNIASESKG